MMSRDAKGYSLWLSREEWGAVMDGLILERERSEQRKRVNPESCSDARSAMCLDLIQKIGTPATLPQGATMTTLEELREAVERYRNPYGYSDSEVFAAEAILIADAFLDRSPITRERLLELGFEPIDGDDHRLMLGGVRYNFRSSDNGVCFVNCVAEPQPKTIGQLRFLLQSLGDSA
jgi:hypothetical protein